MATYKVSNTELQRFEFERAGGGVVFCRDCNGVVDDVWVFFLLCPDETRSCLFFFLFFCFFVFVFALPLPLFFQSNGILTTSVQQSPNMVIHSIWYRLKDCSGTRYC